MIELALASGIDPERWVELGEREIWTAQEILDQRGWGRAQ